MMICINGTWSGCLNATLPAPEACDGLDNDCDGVVDDGCNITNITETNITVEEKVIQYGAVLGRPVKWVKKVKLSQESANVTVKLPKGVNNVTVRKITNITNHTIQPRNITIKTPTPITGAFLSREDRNSMIDMIFDFLSSVLDWFRGAITGHVVASVEVGEPNVIINESLNETELTINEEVEEVEIEYWTDPPVAVERVISSYVKIVNISSEYRYENILSYTYLPSEAPASSIRLYWLVNGTRTEMPIDAYDTNGNGLADYIEWVTPHTSNQTFEVRITIFNVHSYPTLGGNWTVSFNTTGRADLRISPSNGTAWSRHDNESTDLQFLGLRCGDQPLNYTWDSNTVIIHDYECNQTSYETSKELTEGKHYLRFEFGDQTAYAENYVFKSFDTNLGLGNYTEDTWYNTTGTGGVEAGPDARNTFNYADLYADALVGYWRFTKNSSADLSVQGNDGTFKGDATAENSTLVLDGDGDYVNFGNDATLNFNNTKNYTWSSWIKYEDSSQDELQCFISKDFCVGKCSGFNLCVNTSANEIVVCTQPNSGSWSCEGTDSIVSNDLWIFPVIVYNGSQGWDIYINGVYNGTATITASSDTNSDYYIGAGVDTSQSDQVADYYFNGSIDEVMIFNRSLGAEEIKALYKARSPDANYTSRTFDAGRVVDWQVFNATQDQSYDRDTTYTNGLELWMDFDDDFGTAVIDKSANHNDGTRAGDATINDTNCHDGQCLHLDGANDWVDIPNVVTDYPVTLSYWVKPMNHSETGVHVYLHLGSGKWVAGGIWDAENKFLTSVSGVTASEDYFKDNEWTNVVLVRTATGMSIFIDGINRTEYTSNSWSQSGTVTQIGTRNSSPDRCFNGSIDDVQIWSRPLSLDEIAKLYKKGVARLGYQTCTGSSFEMCRGPDATVNQTWMSNLTSNDPSSGATHLVGYWRFNDNSSVDQSVQRNDGTFKGDAQATSDYLALDGDGDYV
ncbi:MAG: hypothetical protein DRO12_06535, partial [Thermoprotei archaeon]